MVAPLLLLASLIIPSALQQQPETVDQKLSGQALYDWLGEWKTYSSGAQVQITRNQAKIENNQENLVVTLDEVVAEAEGVKAQLEDLIEDFAELVKMASDTERDKPAPD